MLNPSISLLDYLDGTYAVTRDITPASVYQLRRTCRIFSAWLGREPLLSEFNEILLSRWVVAMQAKYAPATVKKLRGDILGILADAFDYGSGPEIRQRRVRKPSVPEPNPQGWTREEVERLIVAARNLEGRVKSGVRRCVYYETAIRCGWETGLRIGDLKRLRMEQISDDGILVVTQKKTGAPVPHQIESPTLALFRSIATPLPLEWKGAPRMLYYWWKKVRTAANVTSDGAFQKIRISAGTDVAVQDRHAMTHFLGHASERADKYYLAHHLMPPPAVRPRRLFG